nr:uncharacterized protein LOC112039402 [Quercus suber]
MDIKFKLNEKTKVSVHCKYDCGWRVYTSQIAGELTFQIKTMVLTYTCGRTFKHSQVTSTYVARKYLENFNKNPNWAISGVKHRVMQDVNVDLSINQVYRAKRKAREFILGNERLQFGKFRDYAGMIRVTDAGNKVVRQTEIIEPNTQPKFKRMYVRYNAQKVGSLEGCTPLVRLNGCHLKGKFGGHILSATARDENDNIFHVALGVVEQDNKNSWVWFLQTFVDDIGRPDKLNLVFISNRQKNLEQLKVDSKPFSAIPSACYKYEVDNEYERHVVNLSRKCCTCRVWDLTGIPCQHGVAAIYKNLERPENYVYACML